MYSIKFQENVMICELDYIMPYTLTKPPVHTIVQHLLY